MFRWNHVIETTRRWRPTWILKEWRSTCLSKIQKRVTALVPVHGNDVPTASFMLESKPVVLAGHHLVHSAQRRKLLTHIPSWRDNGIVSECRILIQTVQTERQNSSTLRFHLNPEPSLSVNLKIRRSYCWQVQNKELIVHESLDNVVIVKMFPEWGNSRFTDIQNLKELYLKTYGSEMRYRRLVYIVKLIKKGCTIINVTQCSAGSVNMGETSTSDERNRSSLEKISHRSGHYKADVFIRSKNIWPSSKYFEKILRGENDI
jgi:L-asparaginase